MDKELKFTHHELIRLFILCNEFKNRNQYDIDKYSDFVSDDSDEMECIGNVVDISKDNVEDMRGIIRKINKMLDGGFYNE